MFNGLEL